MPQCRTCRHPDVQAINALLVAGESERIVATQYGLTQASVHRHRQHHIPAALAAAHQAAEAARGDDLLGQLRQHVGELRALFTASCEVLRDARAMGDLDRVLKAVDAAGRAHGHALRHLELLAKLAGELDERPTVNLLVAPEWIAVRTAVLRALEAHPQALEDVRAALRRLNAGG